MKNNLFLFVFVSLLFSCGKKDFDINNLNNNKIAILGHGGMGISHSYPMNSQESILKCLNLGADGTEIDVQMTKDGVLIAFHDSLFNYSTNLSGTVHSKTWAEIEGTIYSHPNYSKYNVVKLDDIFKNIPNRDQYLYLLDIRYFQFEKDPSYYSTFNTALIEIIDKYDLVEHVYVENKTRKYIQSLQQLRPDIKQFVFTGFDYAFDLAREFNLSGVTVSLDGLTHERVELLHSNNLMVSTFNTHSKNRNIKAVEHNVDIIQTDKLKHLMKLLKK